MVTRRPSPPYNPPCPQDLPALDSPGKVTASIDMAGHEYKVSGCLTERLIPISVIESTFRPLNSGKKPEKGKTKRRQRKTIGGIPQHVQMELGV